jgi:deoxyribose-phosphate aldolase
MRGMLGTEDLICDASMAAFAENLTVLAKSEYTLLSPALTLEDIRSACVQARRHCIGAVCISTHYTGEAVDILKGSGVRTVAAVGAIHVPMSEAALLAEGKKGLMDGVDELNVPIGLMSVKSGKLGEARDSLSQIALLAAGKANIKVIVDLAVLNDEERPKVLSMVRECGVSYIGLTGIVSDKKVDVSDVSFVRKYVGNNVHIMVDSDVRTLREAKELIAAGADRIALLSVFDIVREIEGSPRTIKV